MKIRFNLLPESQKEHLRTQKSLRTIMEQEIYVLIIFVIFLLSLFAIYFLLKTEASIMKDVEQDIINQSGYGEVIEIHQKFKDVHVQINRIDALDRKVSNWSNFFTYLSDNIAENISVNSLVVTENNVSIKAVADTREDVVDLKEKMRNVEVDGEKCFDKINVPESDLAAPTNVSFSMTFDVNLSCL